MSVTQRQIPEARTYRCRQCETKAEGTTERLPAHWPEAGLCHGCSHLQHTGSAVESARESKRLRSSAFAVILAREPVKLAGQPGEVLRLLCGHTVKRRKKRENGRFIDGPVVCPHCRSSQPGADAPF